MSQAKPEHYPELTAKLDAATPSHIYGALKQDAHDLAQYMHQNAWMQINCVECKKHLEIMIRMLGHLNTMQVTLQASIEANAEAPDAVKN